MNLQLLAVGLRPHEIEKFIIWAFGADYKSNIGSLPSRWKDIHDCFDIDDNITLNQYYRMVSKFRGVVKTPAFGMPYK